MIRRMHDGRYEFRLKQPEAHEVYLVGDFPTLELKRIAMNRLKSGEWVCRMRLPDGAYAFRYWVDGQWCLDEDGRVSEAAAFLTSSVMVKCHTACEWAYVGG